MSEFENTTEQLLSKPQGKHGCRIIQNSQYHVVHCCAEQVNNHLMVLVHINHASQ